MINLALFKLNLSLLISQQRALSRIRFFQLLNLLFCVSSQRFEILHQGINGLVLVVQLLLYLADHPLKYAPHLLNSLLFLLIQFLLVRFVDLIEALGVL